MNKSSPLSGSMSSTGNWHVLEPEQALARLEVGAQGLDAAEVEHRQARYGPNRLPERRGRGRLARLAAQFNNLLIQILITAALITALLGHTIDTAVILAVVLVNTIFGYVQEGRAERALNAIQGLLSPRARVVRAGRRESVAAETLVPGDIVQIEAGDRVPADLRLFKAHGLQIDEAALTGESLPVEKTGAAVDVAAALGDRMGMAFSGTLVTVGQGSGVVVATGQESEIGRISSLLAEVQVLTTPLLRQMATFTRWLSMAIFGVGLTIFLIGWLWRDLLPGEVFMMVVGLTVAAIPEGLPAILTVTLAIGVQRMARRHAIIRRLPVVETLGAVSTICSDKTGTLTRNEMTVRSIVTADHNYEVEGGGYAPHGSFSRDGREVDPESEPLLCDLLNDALLCNDAGLREHHGQWQAVGDPMEAALVAVAVKAGFDPHYEAEAQPRLDVIPFDARHRYMATLHHDHAGHHYVVVKGAPEIILALCKQQIAADGSATALDTGFWQQRIHELAHHGRRVLALARKQVPVSQRELCQDTVGEGLILIGLLGLIDPPRDEAIAAVHECHAAGIDVKMITGDHAETARAIAGQIGLKYCDEVLTGQDIDMLDDASLAAAVERVDVFARTSPAHKLRLVMALQADGKVVAMTGDGVNDAPALKRADIGIAMGSKGTEAAKEAAEMVLADDNFASIVAAVREGRTVYDNLKKAIGFLLPINGGESFSLIIAILFGLTLPIAPLQILWVNMVSSVALALVLAFEPAEPDIMQRPPRASGEALLSLSLIWRLVLVSILFTLGIYGLFGLALQQGMSVEAARTLAVNALVAMEVWFLFSVRYLNAPSFTFIGVQGTRPVLIGLALVIGLQLLFIYAPFMNALFDSRPMPLLSLAWVFAAGFAVFILLELEKWLQRQFRLSS